MIITLSEPVQKPLEQTELVVITERVDDVVLLLGQMMKTGLLEIVDDHLPQYWSQEGVELGLEGDDLAGVHGVNRPGSRIGLDQYGPWGQIKVILFLVEKLGPDVLAVRHVLHDNILLDCRLANIIEAKDESEDFLSSGWTSGAVQIWS